MLHEGYFDKVYYRFWEAGKQDSVLANVFAIHGLGGHSFWFNHAADAFNKNKINMFSFDLPGFGQSKYPIGTIDSYKTWINTSKEMLEKFKQYFEVNKPVFILGHSMGALIAVLMSKNVKAKGWIISVPSFEGHKHTWNLIDFVLPVLCKSFFKPSQNITLPFGPENITKNKDTQLRIKKDPLRVISPDAAMFRHVYFLTLSAKRYIASVPGPVLMLIAGQDKVCSNLAMEEYFKKIKSNDKLEKVYQDSYHDLFIEDEVEEIVNDISNWIKDRA